MHARGPILAIAVTTAALTGCIITGAPVSMQAIAPADADMALGCATQQLVTLGYTIAAGDGQIGFVRGERHRPRIERFFVSGIDERDVLTAMVLADPATGASSLLVTAALRSQGDAGSPTETGSADAISILTMCAEQTTAEGQGGVGG